MARPRQIKSDAAWIDDWIASVENDSATMSQRTRSSIDAHGGLDAAIRAACAKDVHLVQLTDDKGKLVVAASRKPFTTLC